MPRMRLLVFAITVLLPLLAGCPSPKSAPSTKFALPYDWPIPQLTLPAGAKLVCDPWVSGNVDFTDKSELEWTVFFACPGGMDRVVEHVESCLRPLSFIEYYVKNLQTGDHTPGVRCTYFSSDGLTKVVLLDETGAKDGTSSGEPDYALSIVKLATRAKELENVGNREGSDGSTGVLRPL